MSDPEMKRLLAWFVAQCEGDSGTGASYWQQFPEFLRAKLLMKSATPCVPMDMEEADWEVVKKLNHEISLRLLGRPIGLCEAALASQVSLLEGTHGTPQTLFDTFLEYFRSKIPEAKACAAMERGRN